MQALQKERRLIPVSRKSDSDAAIVDPTGSGSRRRLTWNDRVGQVTYVAIVEPDNGTLVDFNELYIEYRYSWLMLWEVAWIALVAIGVSLMILLARRLLG